MQSKATTVEGYLAELPADRRAAIQAVRKVILANLDKDYREGMGYGMIGYAVPHSVFLGGYHCDPRLPLPFAGLASQKNYMSLYLMCVCGACVGPDGEHARRFREEWAETGKKLDMGKACIRFKKVEDLPLELIGETIRRFPARRYIEYYENALRSIGKSPAGGDRGAGRRRDAAATSRSKKKPIARDAAKPRKAGSRKGTARK